MCSPSHVCDWEWGLLCLALVLGLLYQNLVFWQLLMLSLVMPRLPQESTLLVTSHAVLTQERLNPDLSLLGCYCVSKYGEGLSDRGAQAACHCPRSQED